MVSIILLGCDYSPIYSKKNNVVLNIKIMEYEGDTQINSRIRSRLKYHGAETGKLYEITMNTIYEKSNLLKDSAGNVTKYRLEAISTFQINEETYTFVINESFIMDKFNDDFEEANYEKKIKENIAFSIYEKLIQKLSNINDL